MEVREVAAADAAALSRIHAATWHDTYIGQVSDADAQDGIARANGRDWTAHADLRVSLGGGVMRLYVLPEHQGRGGGRLLLQAACAQLAQAGFDEVTLWTLHVESNRAHGFYIHLGWIREDVHRPDDPDDIRYRRHLP